MRNFREEMKKLQFEIKEARANKDYNLAEELEVKMIELEEEEVNTDNETIETKKETIEIAMRDPFVNGGWKPTKKYLNLIEQGYKHIHSFWKNNRNYCTFEK